MPALRYSPRLLPTQRLHLKPAGTGFAGLIARTTTPGAPNRLSLGAKQQLGLGLGLGLGL